MLTLKRIDDWMEEYRQGRISELKDLAALINEIRAAKIHDQQTINVISDETKKYYDSVELVKDTYGRTYEGHPRGSRYNGNAATPGYTVEDVVVRGYSSKAPTIEADFVSTITFRGIGYPLSSNYHGAHHELIGRIIKRYGHTVSDYQSLTLQKVSDVAYNVERDDAWIIKTATKETQERREAIEAAVKKICGDEIVSGTDTNDGILVKGSNGKVAHVWAIHAGGYNIQCLHIRVLVKEVK